MATLNVTLKHTDGTTATGNPSGITTPGTNNPIVVPAFTYSCGHIHILHGTQNSNTRASGKGPGSVVPGSDTPSKGRRPEEDLPSWDSTITTPVPKKKTGAGGSGKKKPAKKAATKATKKMAKKPAKKAAKKPAKKAVKRR